MIVGTIPLRPSLTYLHSLPYLSSCLHSLTRINWWFLYQSRRKVHDPPSNSNILSILVLLFPSLWLHLLFTQLLRILFAFVRKISSTSENASLICKTVPNLLNVTSASAVQITEFLFFLLLQKSFGCGFMHLHCSNDFQFLDDTPPSLHISISLPLCLCGHPSALVNWQSFACTELELERNCGYWATVSFSAWHSVWQQE